jgi:large subunit ribosomal protein L18
MGRAKGPAYNVPFRRRREGKTNYRRRLKLVLSREHRVVVRKSNRYLRMQLVSTGKYGDNTLVAVMSSELTKYGYESGKCNCPAAYLTGLLFGRRAKEAGFAKGVLDIGLRAPVHGSIVYAALKGALDSGLTIPHDPSVIPSEDRLSGKIIATHSQNPTVVDKFHDVKDKIMNEQLKEKKKKKRRSGTE